MLILRKLARHCDTKLEPLGNLNKEVKFYCMDIIRLEKL